MPRISKENYYLDIAETVLERATCLRRVYGAIIVKNDEIISTGYNGAPRGRKNCVDLGFCTREELQVPRGERYELCRSVHSEANAIISPGATWSAAPSILWAATRARASCCTTRQAVPCAAVRSSTQGSKRSSSAARRQSLRSCPCGSGSTRTILFPKHKKRRSLFKRPSFFCSAFSGSISRCRRSGT